VNARLCPTPAAAPLPMAPPSSIVSSDQAKRIDDAMLADKLANGYGARNDARALALQIQSNPRFWGSC
jgi:hypothetical protein